MEKIKLVLKKLGENWQGIWVAVFAFAVAYALFENLEDILYFGVALGIISFLCGTLFKDNLK